MANEQNLKPIQSESEAREKGRQGGIASGKARRERKTLADTLRVVLEEKANDAWYDGAMNFFGEERMHFRINEHFKIGAILDVTYFGEFAITPFLGVRYDF